MFIIEISEGKHDANVISITTVVCNLLQALNMSINVILYLTVNSQFRKSLRELFAKCGCKVVREAVHRVTKPAAGKCNGPKCDV